MHHVVLRWFDTEAQPQQSISHQVEPQQLQREQRHGLGHRATQQDERNRPQQHDGDFSDVTGDGELDEAAQVVVDHPAFLDGRDDGGEVIVAQHHVRGLLRDIGAGDTHRHADIGLLQRGRVVDAITRHRDHLALSLQRTHDAELVFRRDAGEHGHAAHRLPPLRVGQPVEFRSGEDRIGTEAQFTGNHRRRERMVTRDHHRANAGGDAPGDGILHLRTWRIDDANHADENQILLGLGGGLRGGDRAEGDPQHAHPALGERRVGGQDPRPPLVAHRLDPAVRAHRNRQLEQAVHRAFDKSDVRRVQRRQDPEGRMIPGRRWRRVDGGHALAIGIERQFADPRHRLEEGLLAQATAKRRDEQRRLRGIPEAHHLSVFRRPMERGVVAQRTADEHQPDGCRAKRLGRRGAVSLDERRMTVAQRFIDIQLVPGHVDDPHSHPVLRQRARLVRADDGDRTERFHCRQFADERVALEHALGPKRQRKRDDRRETLRNHGDGHADGREQHIPQRLATGNADAKHEQRDDDAPYGEPLAHGLEPLLQRRRLDANRLDERRDLAQLGFHAGGDDDAPAPPVRDQRAHIGHVHAVTDRHLGVRQWIGALVRRFGFAGEGGLLDPEIHGLDQAYVGRNRVARLEHHHIARRERARGDLPRRPVAHDAHRGHRQLLERGNGPLGAVLLKEAEQSEEHDDRENGARFEVLAEDEREDGRGDEDQHHDGRELLPENPPQASRTGLDQFVRAVPRQTRGGLGAGKAAFGMRLERLEHLCRRADVPGHDRCRRRLDAGFYRWAFHGVRARTGRWNSCRSGASSSCRGSGGAVAPRAAIGVSHDESHQRNRPS